MRNWLKNIADYGIYPAPIFRRRIEEEINRARRNRALLALVFVEPAEKAVIQNLRNHIRPMDVIGCWKMRSAVLLSESPSIDGLKGWGERISQISRTVLRLAMAS